MYDKKSVTSLMIFTPPLSQAMTLLHDILYGRPLDTTKVF